MFTATIAVTALLGSMTIAAAPPDRPADVDAVIEAVSPAHLRSTIDKLVTFGTRHTFSETESDDRGIGAARRWLRDELQKIADASGRDDITVELMVHAQQAGRRAPQDIEVVNVVMTIPGTMPEAADRRVVVLGHYDSRNASGSDAEGEAPGANDDGSGTALVLELARVFSTRPCDATTVFLMTAGEEQGLFGARWFARTAVDNEWNIEAGFSNDIMGDPTGPDGRMARHQVRVFSQAIPSELSPTDLNQIRSLGLENDSPSRQLARYIADIAKRHDTNVKPWLIYRTDRFLRGGDHSAFNDLGFAAVRFSELYEHYDRQHQNVREVDGQPYGDVARFVDEEYLADVSRLNAAAMFTMANAPRPPANARLSVRGLANTTTIRWEAPPETDVAGYEVVWRDTTSPTWDHAVDVGNATEYTSELSKDNWFFAVRAYDTEGHRSQIAIPTPGR